MRTHVYTWTAPVATLVGRQVNKANNPVCPFQFLIEDEKDMYTKETRHILCVNFLVVNECDAHLFLHWVKLNKGRLRCIEIIWKDEVISDVSYQNVTKPLKSIFARTKKSGKIHQKPL